MVNINTKLKFFGRTARLTACGIIAAGLGKKTVAESKITDYAKLRELYANEGGNASIGDASISLVVAAVTMGVGSMILSKIFPSIVGSDAKANQTIANIQNTTWDAISLLPIALTVFAAVVIIGVVMYLRR